MKRDNNISSLGKCATACDIVAPSTIASFSPQSASAALSIFHEPWWLDIATQGSWKLATVKRNNQIIGEMPYTPTRLRLWRVAHLPPLTRTLGPVIKPVTDSNASQRHHRLDVTAKLIEQLPECDSFFQVFDSRIDDAIAFALKGFLVSARYTFQIDANCSTDEVWASLDTKTRNVIRSAQRNLTIAPIATPGEFIQFYETNLASRSRTNAYSSEIMRQLVKAFVERKAGTLLGAYGTDGRLVAAIGLVWDRHAAYYLLSSRVQDAHCGSISLLLWTSIQRALACKLTFDFDGFASPSTFHFLNAFGATLRQRLAVERLGTGYSLARAIKRRIAPSTEFAPTL